MTLYKGNTLIAGISNNTKYNAHNLLDFKWSDCTISDMSWLEADSFSWQSGSTYSEAYNHLVADVQGQSSTTETVGSYTITLYRASDGHKIVLADQETTVANIYNETGVAWYYILDTTNTKFKLPRTKYGFEGLRSGNAVGTTITESLPNITGTFGYINPVDSGNYYQGLNIMSGAFSSSTLGGISPQVIASASSGSTSGYGATIKFSASDSSSIYQYNVHVQEFATQMYLYFYVGDFSQTATEQTAGLNASLFNNKQDVGDCVLKTGDTMTGTLKLDRANYIQDESPCIVKFDDVIYGTNPSESMYPHIIQIQDGNENIIGSLEYHYMNDGLRQISLQTKKAGESSYSFFRVGFGSNGDSFTSFSRTDCVDGQWINTSQAIISSSTSLNGSTALNYRISVLPNDGHKYEVLVKGRVTTGSTSGNYVYLQVHGNELSGTTHLCGCQTRSSSTVTAIGSGIIIASYVPSGSTNLTVSRSSNWTGNMVELVVYAYRRIGTNT